MGQSIFTRCRANDTADPNAVMAWVASHKSSNDSRNLIIKTAHEDHWEGGEDDEQGQSQLKTGQLLNFFKWDAKRPPKFEPSYGTHLFFHKKRLFIFSRQQNKQMDSSWGFTTLRVSISLSSI